MLLRGGNLTAKDMVTRRDFLHTAAALGSSNIVWGMVPEIISRTLAIDPAEETTYLDAEHVVILMQENRSFDHAFGSLSGVRGFRDPRIHRQPDGTPVWFQANKDGSIVPPFRMDIEGSNVTWIGGTPHSWPDQVDARNGGKYDKWLTAKARRDGFPMTMGFFTREDIPFYYALADAFTVCDYAFCSSLTGTTPNRLYFWSGTIREDAKSPARVQNGDTDYEDEAAWTTYPERLEEAGITWNIYQNEISIDTGFKGDEDAWLSNFTDNPIEWFTQYRVRFSKTRRAWIQTQLNEIPKQMDETQAKLSASDLSQEGKEKLTKQLEQLKSRLSSVQKEAKEYTEEAWQALSAKDKAIHSKAFSTNEGDPGYRSVVEHEYQDGETTRKINVPKGDVLHRFRSDVEGGQLPKVAWIVAPERFSDHPGSAWFGAWYLSEILNILTKDPEVWKKTIFIVCYDENDGFFDHIPPFVAPHPNRPETGKVSEGIDTTEDVSNNHNRDSPIGLGYRCPLLVMSPWSRGGCVNSEVCDHTSILMFLETWLAGKGTPVVEKNISQWRRTVCGDLTSVFKPFKGEKYELPKFLERNAYIERIHKASFKSRPVPAGTLTSAEAKTFDVGAFQEHGSRHACPLPYRLEASIERTESSCKIEMEARKSSAGKSSGSPFNAYSYGDEMICRAYAVKSGDTLTDDLPSSDMVRIDGPNGFTRQLNSTRPPHFTAKVRQDADNLPLALKNLSDEIIDVEIKDESYGAEPMNTKLGPRSSKAITLSTKAGKRWYDYSVSSDGATYRFAGRLETGDWGPTDPALD